MRETTIHWMNDEKCADVSTCDPRLIAQIEGNGDCAIQGWKPGIPDSR